MMNTIQTKEGKEIKFMWDDSAHKQFLKMISDFEDDFGRSPQIKTMREDTMVYHLNVMCAMVSKLIGEEIDVLEIGSYRGQSSWIFANWFKSLTCVDAYGKLNEVSEVNDLESEVSKQDELDVQVKLCDENSLIRFIMENNVVAQAPNIDLHVETSDDYFLKNEGKKFDLIYIDGDHRYSQQMRDYTNALNFVKENGIIGGHDYSWDSTQRVIEDMGFVSKPMIHFLDDSFLIIPENLL
jgi:predicted O-methyltransferase YrrM